MTQQHIDNDTLSLYAKTVSNPENDSMSGTLYNAVLDHLAVCQECRDQVAIISTLLNDGLDIRQQAELTEELHQLICDYVDGLLPPDQADKARALIEHQPDAMKAALHYQSHIDAMQSQLPREEGDYQAGSSAPQAKGTFFANLLLYSRQFFNMRLPVVYPITATAALFVAVLLVTQSPQVDHNQTIIASYQDNPTIQYTDKNKLPGVGFFSQSASTSKPFQEISIELIADNTIKISWPEVDGAELYKMRIQVFNQGKKTVLKENTTEANHTTFILQPEHQAAVAELKHNRRYEWVLYGNTKDDRMFYASGGFVISKVDTGEYRDYD